MKELPAQDVIEQAKECWRGGRVRITGHCRERMAERNVGDADITSAFETGAVDDAQWNEKFNEWRYRILGQDVEGDDLSVLVTFEGDTLISFITVF